MQKLLTAELKRDSETYTECMEIGHTDPLFVNANSIFDDMMTQCEVVCQKVLDHPVFGT